MILELKAEIGLGIRELSKKTKNLFKKYQTILQLARTLEIVYFCPNFREMLSRFCLAGC